MVSASEDRSLLERLNALRPSSVTLDQGTISRQDLASSPVPASREDALSVRLRLLRNGSAPSHAASPTPARDPASPSPAPGDPQSAASENAIPLRKPSYRIPSRAGTGPAAGDLPYLFPPLDDQALEELLEGLGFGPEAKADGEESGDHDATVADADEELDLWEGPAPQDDTRKIKNLVADFRKAAAAAPEPGDGDQGADAVGNAQKGEKEDDPDNEHTQRAVEKILSAARHDANLHLRIDGKQSGGKTDTHQSNPGDGEKKKGPGNEPRETEPAMPEQQDGYELTLPAVPTELVDPVLDENESGDSVEDRKYVDFENNIAVRMAALRGLGSGINTDAFGLPTAPTFQPDEHTPVPAKKKRTPAEDEDSWCNVCYDDGAIRCIGCEDDVYCSRCWRNTHVGPSAGYDERGHKWKKLVKGDSDSE